VEEYGLVNAGSDHDAAGKPLKAADKIKVPIRLCVNPKP
jgi:hypothetical protein